MSPEKYAKECAFTSYFTGVQKKNYRSIGHTDAHIRVSDMDNTRESSCAEILSSSDSHQTEHDGKQFCFRHTFEHFFNHFGCLLSLPRTASSGLLFLAMQENAGTFPCSVQDMFAFYRMYYLPVAPVGHLTSSCGLHRQALPHIRLEVTGTRILQSMVVCAHFSRHLSVFHPRSMISCAEPFLPRRKSGRGADAAHSLVVV